MKTKATIVSGVFVGIAVLLALLVIPGVMFPGGKEADPALADAIRSAPPPVRGAYAYAVAHPEILRYIPCYCGCIAAGHRSNEDCFVDERLAGGSVVYDAMGIG